MKNASVWTFSMNLQILFHFAREMQYIHIIQYNIFFKYIHIFTKKILKLANYGFSIEHMKYPYAVAALICLWLKVVSSLKTEEVFFAAL